MTILVKVAEGSYRDADSRVVEVTDQEFHLVKPFKDGAKGGYIVVDGSPITGKPNLQVKVTNDEDLTYRDMDGNDLRPNDVTGIPEIVKELETDEDAMARIRSRFTIIEDMTDAVAEGDARGLIISGPPGVGKSFGVENVIDQYEAEFKLGGGKNTTEIVKGSMTPIGLYKTLYHNSGKGDIIVFDDCDSILFDEVTLNMLKAVLDSGKKRFLSWKSESHTLRKEDIPDRFPFEAGIIFITNVNFETAGGSKIRPHLNALMSRCHYVDLEMNSERDRFLRIDQIVGDGMLDEYNFGKRGNAEVVNFMVDNAPKLREISLRMVIKIADLKRLRPDGWKDLALSTCTRRSV